MTTSDAKKLAIIEALYAATGEGDFDKAETYLSDDLFICEADELPFGGRIEGKTALRELFGKVMGMMDVASLDVVQTVTGGDYAVTILSMRFQDPNLEPALLCELFRFRDGKVCEIRPYYFSSLPVLAACEAKSR